MRVIAATFPDRNAAQRTLEYLQERYELGSKDAELAPLGSTESEREGATLLAGRFYDDRRDAIHELVQRNNGRVAMDVDEAQTHRCVAAPAQDGGHRPRRRSTIPEQTFI